MEKPLNNRAWLMVAPVFAIVLFSALLPMMTVVNYSLQDSFGHNQFFWNGDAWFRDLLNPATEIGARFQNALLKNLSFSLVALLIEVPLGIAMALCLPRKGWAIGPLAGNHRAADVDPLERRRHNLANLLARGHWFVRRRFDRAGHSLQCHAGTDLGVVHDRCHRCLALDSARYPADYAGLRAIPDAYYQAARIDAASRWATFVNIELPKLQKVLVIVILLRFMQTFMIYTEPFVVTGGGPGSATTFLSIDLVKIALGQVDLGSAAAMSLVYNLITLTLCWVFFTIMMQLDRRRYA